MSLRRLLPILLLSLLLAPLGRMGAAEAKAMPQHAAIQMSWHCAEQPQPANDADHRELAIDCMIACAVMAPVADPFTIPAMAALGPPEPAPTSTHAGIRPEADPPPPRLA